MCERVSKCIVNLILYTRCMIRETYRILKCNELSRCKDEMS
jgi:hypothetical protein